MEIESTILNGWEGTCRIDPVRKYIYIYKWKVNSNIIYLKLIISVMVLNVNGLNNATTKQRVDFSYQPR